MRMHSVRRARRFAERVWISLLRTNKTAPAMWRRDIGLRLTVVFPQEPLSGAASN
ncbi:MAG: hypothetical protein ABI114_01870 [Rhodanobacter sp.]